MDQREVDMQAFVVVIVDIRLVRKEGNLTYLSCNLISFHQGEISIVSRFLNNNFSYACDNIS